MNRDTIINEMISFIEDAERDLQASKLSNDTKNTKSNIVNRILDELEKKVSDEN